MNAVVGAGHRLALRNRGCVCAILAFAVCIGACKRTTKVVVLDDTDVLSDISGSPNVIYLAPGLHVFEADEPGVDRAAYWWIETPKGKGLIGGHAGVRVPVSGHEAVAGSTGAVVHRAWRPDAPVSQALAAGKRVEISELPGTRMPPEWFAVIVGGRPVGFVKRSEVSQQQTRAGGGE